MNRASERSGSDYYDTVYRDYERQNPERKLDHYISILHSRGGGKRAPRLLDVGCGRGVFLARVSMLCPTWSLSGTDVDPHALEETKTRVPNVELRLGSAEQMSFDEASFDFITAWDVLEHVTDLRAARDAIGTMLRPGGLIAFVVPVYDGITGPVIRLLDKDPTHRHRRARSFWIEWAEEEFDGVEWHGLYRYLLPGGLYVHLPTRRFRDHTPAIAVTAFYDR